MGETARMVVTVDRHTLTRAVIGRHPRRTIARAAALLVASVILFGYVLLPIRTYGASMLPTYQTSSFTLANRLAYAWRVPKRGDVVAIRMAGRRIVLVKRVIGLPGERIRIAAGQVFINGQRLDEPYVKYRASWDVPESSLGANHFFFIGDNRGMPMHHHDFGRAPRERIVGKLLF
jgi:signal peptidase I